MLDEEMAEEYFEELKKKKIPFNMRNVNREIKQAYLAGLNAGRPKWHDLRKDPNDLPKKEKLGQTFVVAFAYNIQTQKYYSFDCAEYIDKGRFITHTTDGSGENNAYKIIAWKEIVPPKEGE